MKNINYKALITLYIKESIINFKCEIMEIKFRVYS